MLVGLSIRDVVLISALDLTLGRGLTALTGETGAGKSIVLDALGLALGAKADAGLVRAGTALASAAAIFSLAPTDATFDLLEEKGLSADRSEDLILRRQVSADGRSRAFINDQATSVAVLREVGARLIEIHGQHETAGLLDPKTHRPLLDEFGRCRPQLDAVAAAWTTLRDARAPPPGAASLLWSSPALSAAQFAGMVVSPTLTGTSLTLAVNVPPGTYAFVLTATLVGVSASSTILVTVSQAPRNGFVRATPANGVALSTSYSVSAEGWTGDAAVRSTGEGRRDLGRSLYGCMADSRCPSGIVW